MTEEELEEIKEKYELSIIKYKEANQARISAKHKLELDEVAYKNSQVYVQVAQSDYYKNREQYEDAFYKFYEENNE